MNFKEFLYFSLFSSVTSAALNTMQISYGMSYFRHRDSSDIFTYDIARQSVVDKMVREISLEVREKSGNLFFTFLWEPWLINCQEMDFIYSKGHFQGRKGQVCPFSHNYWYYSVVTKCCPNLLHHVASLLWNQSCPKIWKVWNHSL